MDARESLVRDAARGCTTLVLGAGVAGACNVATWRQLAQRLWLEAFGTPLPTVADDPRFYPFAFEHVQAAMREQFAPRLRAVLYEAHELPARRELLQSRTNTLAVLARVIAREACSARRRLVRVITLNVDDLLERSIDAIVGSAAPVVSIVRGGLSIPRSTANAALPIYHLHGYLRSGADAEGALDAMQEASDVLVFTDLQYWASAAIPSSHMNRTFSFALHDSHCVFIGTSMLDLNIWRWLAMRAFEVAADCKSLRDAHGAVVEEKLQELYDRSLHRHYWVTSEEEKDTEFLSRSLALRGVGTVRITRWSDDSLYRLMTECFPEAE